MDHSSRKFQRKRFEIFGSAAFQRLDALDHFQRIANSISERFLHRGQKGFSANAMCFADCDHRFEQAPRASSNRFMNAPPPNLTSSTSADSFREFLAQNRRSNQRYAFYRRGDIPQRVKFFVRRSDFSGLPDHRCSNGPERAFQFIA